MSLEIPEDGPDYFFTAALSGCSVFIRGEPENPTVIHCGKSTSLGVENPEILWKKLVDFYHGKKGAGIGKSLYTHNQALGQGSIQKANDQFMLDHLKSHNVHFKCGGRTGAVFGERKDGKWEFYLQTKVTVSYQALGASPVQKLVTRYKKGFLGFKKKVRERVPVLAMVDKNYTFPESVIKIYPGRSRADIPPDTIEVVRI